MVEEREISNITCYELDLIMQDQLGVEQRIQKLLERKNQIKVERIVVDRKEAAMCGGILFLMNISLMALTKFDIGGVIKELEEISDSVMINVKTP